MNINIEEINKKLSTEFMAKNIIYYETVESTQDKAKELIKKEQNKIQDGTYILTDIQTKGKGTHDRKWHGGEYENILGTIILKPNCNIKKLSNLTVMIAKCLVNVITRLYKINLEIKHPNDILCNGKKIAGILTESTTNREIVQYIYIGIGININQIDFNMELEDIATSLKKEFGKDYSRENIISEFFNEFEKQYIKMIK